MPKENSRAASAAGLLLAGAGVSHFVVPQLYEGVTKSAFPTDTRRHVYLDGAIETAVGVAMVSQKTRTFALVGLVLYLLYLGGNVARNR